MRNLIIFALCFAIGAVIALIARTAFHKPYAAAPIAPAVQAAPTPPDAGTPDTTINTICPVCGMDVDPAIPAQIWQGKRIGLGCAACIPKFPRHADHYGAAALTNSKASKP